jgi:hypothetical protein
MSVANRATAVMTNTVIRDRNQLAVEPRECWHDFNLTREGHAVDPGA